MSTQFDFAKFYKLLPAGREDLLTWLALLGGAGINHPAADGIVRAALSAGGLPAALSPASGSLVTGAGALGALWAGDRLYRRWQEVSNSRVLHSDVHIRSNVDLPSPEKWKDWDGMLLGYTVDTGKPIIIDWDHWMRHCFIIGQSGVGKTVLGEWMMLQQIVRGGSMLFIDGKMDEGNLRKIHAMATYAGRRDDLLVVSPGNPSLSNTYNPVLYGDADEVASRILSLIPSSENSPGADHYRQQANQALTTLVNGIKSINANSGLRSHDASALIGMAYNFFDLSLVLQNQKALLDLESRINKQTPGGAQFASWLDQFKTAVRDKDGGGSNVQLDLKKMKDTFGGIGGRMHAFGTGNFGAVTESYDPEVKIFDAIMANKIIYIALPTMGKAEAASNFGKMTIGDYRTAVSWLQSTPKHKRPWPPTLCFFDEAGSYVTQAWSRIFEQARSAHQVLVPAVQTMANLDAVSPELRAMVLGNTWTKVIFKLGESETVDTITSLIGKEMYGVTMVGYSESESSSKQSTSAAQSSSGFGQGKSVSMKEQEGFRVNPTTLSALGKGEAVVLYGNSHIYHVKIPMVEFTSSFLDTIGPYEVNHCAPRYVKGLDYGRRLHQFLISAQNGSEEKHGN